MRRAFSVPLAAVALVALGCSSADESARTTLANPDRASFELPSRVLLDGCGTLDCHGSPLRYFRLVGYGAARLPDAGVRPGDPKIFPAEVDANYAAVLGIEPEVMREVVADRGAEPERLTLIRKARGTEHHKGNSPAPAGSDRDLCLVSWLSGAVDTAACTRALPATP